MLASQLKEHNISPSVHRLAIYDYMLNHLTHPSVDSVYNDLQENMPTLSKTTVYNTLKLFAEKGLVQSLTISDKCVRFDSDTSSHAHFLCDCCGELYDFPRAEVNLSDDLGFKIEKTQIYYKGTCPKCLKK
ncbi:MAG: Fur family transcriptional regulator [Rikenellaceae bacterium]